MNQMQDSKAILLVISAASGVGKSSLARALAESSERIALSVSYTTREIGEHEVNGREYHFISKEEFAQMIEARDFIEYAEVYGNHYGTSRTAVENKLESGVSVILEIDWQGAVQVENRFPSVVKVFILPPTIDDLKTRLMKRGRDSEVTIEKRLAAAMDDMKQCVRYEHLVLNDEFDAALEDLQSLLPGGSGTIRPIPQSVMKSLGIGS